MIAGILQAALDAIRGGETFALITVIEAEGSSPGKPGHKMILFPDGRQKGTVGGGRLEQLATVDALGMIRRGGGGVLAYTLDPSSPDSIGALCGGKAVLAVEVVVPTTRLLLCGGGHVAEALARLLRELGLAHSVADEREGMVSRERFPAASELISEAPPRCIEKRGLSAYSHVVILTHSHALDADTLLAVSRQTFPGYIGVIGSRRKWEETRKSLLASGVTAEWLDRVHCPIGLPIGATTPAQIAVSIAAEILKETRESD